MSKKSKKSSKHELSKKDLKKREAALEAEIERREKKAAKKALANSDRVIATEKAERKKAKKKAGKKGASSKPLDVEPMTITAEAEAHVAGDPTPEEIAAATAPADEKPRHPHLVHLDRVGELAAIVADPDAKPKKKAKAEAELAALRAEGERHNAERDAKLAADDAELKKKVAAKRAAREAGDVKSARMPDALDGESEVEYQMRKLHEKDAAKIAELKPRVDELKSAVEAVETEHGREFVVGESVAADAPEEFAKPSESGPELEEGRNGYKIIMLDAEGKPDPRKVRQLTRVTTFVGNIDDETTLKRWDKRKVIEGLAADATSPESEGLIPKINELVHRRDVAIAKAIKADRKGKLGIGEVGELIAAAEKAAKDELDKIHERAAEIAGRHDKAKAGTHLHTLAEISDEKGIDAVREMHENGVTIHNDESGEDVPVTATDLASIEAYAERMARLGAKVIESEAVIVNDSMGYAGRLDRIIMARLPELTVNTPAGVITRPADKRSRRYVTDIKSGRIDLGAGKISRQLAAYALGDLYNLETGERTRHSAATDVALVFHLPQGAGVCTVHAVDIKSGAVLLRLSADVRRARNTGKKTIDTSVDITDPAEGDEPADESAAE